METEALRKLLVKPLLTPLVGRLKTKGDVCLERWLTRDKPGYCAPDHLRDFFARIYGD